MSLQMPGGVDNVHGSVAEEIECLRQERRVGGVRKPGPREIYRPRSRFRVGHCPTTTILGISQLGAPPRRQQIGLEKRVAPQMARRRSTQQRHRPVPDYEDRARKVSRQSDVVPVHLFPPYHISAYFTSLYFTSPSPPTVWESKLTCE